MFSAALILFFASAFLAPLTVLAQAPSAFVDRYRYNAALEGVAFRQDGQLAAYAYLDKNDRIVEAQYFEGDKLIRRVRKLWNPGGQLEREVTTYFRDHEWDAIKEFDYADGRRNSMLYGNNKTGRWGSEGYIYNERGDLEEVEHYRKNGDLAYRTIHDLTYDTAGLLTQKLTTKVLIPTDSTHADWENEVAIGNAQVPTQAAADEAVTMTNYRYDAQGRQTLVEVLAYRGRPTVQTSIRYRGSERIEASVYYDGEGGESFRESATYDGRGRMVSQMIGGETTRYRYARGSGFVVGKR